MQPSDHDLLVRIDERVGNTEIAIKALRTEIAERYVTQDSFEPVKRVVYVLIFAGLAALVTGAALISKGV